MNPFTVCALAWLLATGAVTPSDPLPPVVQPRLHLTEPVFIVDVPPHTSMAAPAATTRPQAGLSGQASWFRAPAGTAAAGRALRAFLGPTWRNSRVRVTGPAGTTVVRLTDWMANERRVVDLNPGAFRAACGPLSRGVCAVRIGRA